MPASLSAPGDAKDHSLAPPTVESHDAGAARNFAMLALYQIVMRTGWIFKTESIIMPAVVDYISGAGWIRGCLPMLNRLGHSIPPVVLARQVKLLPKKKWAVVGMTSLMSALFLLLTWCFFMGFAHRSWMPAAFLVIYASFFMCIGINTLAFTTLQGKLVEVTKRGQLLLASNMIGAGSAVLCAFVLLPMWLQGEVPRFDWIFGFSGVLFSGAAMSVVMLIEKADNFEQQPAATPMHYFADAYNTIAEDRNFRKLALVGALFGTSFMLFPHYQNLGLKTMGLELKSLMWWVVIQNIGTGLFSWPVGLIADRKGNRLVLRIAMLAIAAAPVSAIILLHVGELGTQLYHFVFVLVGCTPVVLRTLQNYTLEVADPADHPRYLSTLSLCSALPMFLSFVVGHWVDVFGFEAVFLSIAGLILLAWLLTFRLQEPRYDDRLETAD